MKTIKHYNRYKIELSPIKVHKLTHGNKKNMSWEEYKVRTEVANNFIEYLKIKIKKNQV